MLNHILTYNECINKNASTYINIKHKEINLPVSIHTYVYIYIYMCMHTYIYIYTCTFQLVSGAPLPWPMLPLRETSPSRSWGPWPQAVGFRVQGLGFRVQGLGFRVSGLGFRVASSYMAL